MSNGEPESDSDYEYISEFEDDVDVSGVFASNRR
jgi:hypothetical protein